MLKSYKEIEKQIDPSMWYTLSYISSHEWLSSIKSSNRSIKTQVLKDLVNKNVFNCIHTPTVILIQGKEILLKRKFYDSGMGYIKS